jgi:hypothetical protein
LKDKLKQDWKKVTYSNLFVNSNFPHVAKFFNELERPVHLIVNQRGKDGEYPFKVSAKEYVPDDVITWYTEAKDSIIERYETLAKNSKDTLFFVSAGPLSEIIIYKMYKANPNNTYVDIGSALDVWTHRKATRSYQVPGATYSDKECFLESAS